MERKGYRSRPAVGERALEKARLKVAVELKNGILVIREEADHD
jgi:hypothetical protein